MWPLICMSLVGLIIVIERTFYLHKGQIRSVEFIDGVKNLLRKHRLIEAITMCEETPGPVGAVVKTALINYNQSPSILRGSVKSTAIVEIPSLEKNISLIAGISRIAPIMGLLGTVLGLLNVALNIKQSDGAYENLTILSTGVYEALLTTGIGLVIAIITLLAHHFLNARVQSIIRDIEWAGHEIVQFLTREIVVKENIDESSKDKDEKIAHP